MEHNTAYGLDGNKLPLSGDEVKQTTMDILSKGEIVLVISKVDDALGVNIMGPPSKETLEILEQVVTTYKKILGEI
jgi:hypothetical protein